MVAAAFVYSPEKIRSALSTYKNELSLTTAAIVSAKSDLRSLVSNNSLRTIAIDAETAWKSINGLRGCFDNELASELVKLREQHRDSFLRSYLIVDANIPGIGPGRTSTLGSYGVESAADISHKNLYGISGIGPVLVSALLSWKQRTLNRYIAPSDSTLTQNNNKKLLAKYILVRKKVATDLFRSLDSYEQCERDYLRKISEQEEKIRASLNLAGSINADIQLLKKSAAATFANEYQFLIF